MNEPQRKLKVGIMGTGWSARMRHLPAFRRNPNVTITSVYNPNEKMAADFAQKHGIEKSFHDLDQFLAQDLDLVSICSPPMSHFDLASAALNHGKHVLLEKPITLTKLKAQELADLAAEKKLILCPSHNFLFCRAMQKADEVLAAGKLGDVTGAMAIEWSSNKRDLPTWIDQLDGGLFFDEAPHLVYLLDHFLGNMKVKSAWRSEFQGLERYEARLIGEKGEGLFSTWMGAPISEWLIVVCGTKGAMILDIFRDALIYFPEEGKRTPKYLFDVLINADKQIWKQMLQWTIGRLTKGSHLFGIDKLINQLVDAILTGSRPPLLPEDGTRVVGVIEEILRQSKLDDNV